jgi:proline dehydrogenase
MISFDNTENAFKSKTDAELNQSFLLFKLIGNPFMVKFGASFSPIALNIGFKGLIKSTIFKQFVGGEIIHDCSITIDNLAKYNIGTILDYSVEGKESETDFDNCLNETLETIEKAKADSNIPFCVFKVTGLARFNLLEKVSANETLSTDETFEWEKVKDRVSKICLAAAPGPTRGQPAPVRRAARASRRAAARAASSRPD